MDVLQKAIITSETIDLISGYKGLTADVVMGYCCRRPYGALDAPRFRFKLIEDLEGPLGQHFYTVLPGRFHFYLSYSSQAPKMSYCQDHEAAMREFEIDEVK